MRSRQNLTAAAARPAGAQPAIGIDVRDVTRIFSGVRALDEITLSIARGSVHALVGGNGAGKSTMLGIIAGRLRPSSGTVELMGSKLPYGNPRAIGRAGLAAIYQELTIIPALTAQANVFLGHPLARWGLLAERAMTRRFTALAEELGVAIPPRATARDLSVADQQMLEIMRALMLEPQVILLDEPTASLSVNERNSLYRTLGDLRRRGITIVLVSHNLDEVMSMADAITVFRDGRIVRDAPRAKWTKQALVRAMLGELGEDVEQGLLEPDAAPKAEPVERPQLGPAALRVTALSVPRSLHAVSLDVRAGEIVGIAGLVGSGRTTLLRALSGLEPRATGTLDVGGTRCTLPRTVRAARQLGIVLLPEDRKGQGLLLGLSAAENVMLGNRTDGSRLAPITPRALYRSAREAAGTNGFDTGRLGEAARNFSGGNQQKILLARTAKAGLKLLLADEPTRGIDIHAKNEIYASLRKSAANGMAVVVVSSEFEELEALSDRIFVLARGRRVAELLRADGETTVSRMLHHAFDMGEPA
jgi:rhamnose transport system ATP-binding protein